tara:strand:- start:12 stop:1454 length:1443 start_codon:yes stop_codon:yes gene_type:complete
MFGKIFFYTSALFLLFSLENGYSSIKNAEYLYIKGRGNVKHFTRIAKNLVKEKYYFSSVPLLKEALLYNKGKRSESFDKLLDIVIGKVGIRQFESLPYKVLMKSKTPYTRYIIARKLFRMKWYEKALNILDLGKIKNDHPIKPYSLMLKGSIFSLKGNYEKAIKNFRECVKSSESRLNSVDDKKEKRQLLINRDSCLLGVSRSYFGKKDYEKSSFYYLDIDKSSYIWPEILFEEAWSSFYQKKFNRTLGKLVTYQAPVFDHIFNPEVNVLEALTYLEMCLWEDSKKAVDRFYSTYEKPLEKVRNMLERFGKKYKTYYLLAKRMLDGKMSGDKVLNKMFFSIIKDPAFLEMYDSFYKGGIELNRIKSISKSKFKSFLMSNIRESLILQRNLIGAYFRKSMDFYLNLISKNLSDMSYIKLEVLSRLRKEILSDDDQSSLERKRGDIKYLRRNEKQYFWSFNREFWADELGDYVFALRSECKK